MDERELVGLLYRADWTRLSLSGTVHGDNTGLHSVYTETLDKGARQNWASATAPPPFGPPPFMPPGVGERTLLVAPGKRYREDNADGSWAGGCDGEWIWQWYAELRPELSVRFDDRPRPPFPVLLAPSWLLTGYELALDDEVTACGRPGVRLIATPRMHGAPGAPGARNRRNAGVVPVPFLLPEPAPTWDEVHAVVDTELGILLRCARRRGDRPVEVTEFRSLTVGETADPARFSAPEGSVAGMWPKRDGGQRRSPGGGLVESLAESLSAFGRDFTDGAAKTVAGLAAGGLGAAMKVAWSPPRQDPFARATAEPSDAEAGMPQDEPAPPDEQAPPDAADPDGPPVPPVSDELLHLLYRSGAEPPRFTATLHNWLDFGALLEAIPASARGAGFGGVGFLVDTYLGKARDGGLDDGHEVSRLRIGGWDQYRIDLVLPDPATIEASGDARFRDPRRRLRRRTHASDGTRTWEVYRDRVVTGPAQPLPADLVELLDPSWLLTYELSDAEEITAADGGRRAWRLVVRMPEPAPGLTDTWLNPGTANVLRVWTGLFFPAVAVIDAESGRLLRITRFKGGRPVQREELRDIVGLDAPADFGFTPPEGLPVTEEPADEAFAGFRRPGGADADEPPSPDGEHVRAADGIDLGDAARGAADAVKKQVDETVTAALDFLGSFLGGRGPGG